MGLDLVEFVMLLEERFRIKIPDEAMSTCEIVGDIAAAVLSQLPQQRERPHMRRFFRVRDLLMKHAGATRRVIRPGTQLKSLLPRNTRRSAWRAMRADDNLLPRLELAKNPRRIAGTLCFVIAAASLLSLAYHVVYAGQPMRGIAALLGGMLWCTALLWTLDFFRREFPTGIVTAADLVHATTPPHPVPELQSERATHEREVLDAVREVIHAHFGIPLDQIRAESRLIKDLKLD